MIEPFELAEQPARVAVGGDDDRRRLELVQAADARMLANLDAGSGRRSSQPPYEPRRLQDRVAGVEQSAREAPRERTGKLVAPLRGEAVLAQRLELGAELVALVLAREPQASRAPERVATKLAHPVDVRLGQPPVVSRPLVAQPLSRTVICHRAAAKRKPAVAAARAGGDLARLVQADAQALPRERQSAGAAGDAAAHDLDVCLARQGPRRERGSGLGEPERVGH